MSAKTFNIATRIIFIFFFVVGLIAATSTLASAQTSASCRAKGKENKARGLVTDPQMHPKRYYRKPTNLGAIPPKQSRLDAEELVGEGLWMLMEVRRKRDWNAQGRSRGCSVGFTQY